MPLMLMQLELVEEYPRRNPVRIRIDIQRSGRAHQIVGEGERSIGRGKDGGSAVVGRCDEGALGRVDSQHNRPGSSAIQVECSAADGGSAGVRGENHFARGILLELETRFFRLADSR